MNKRTVAVRTTNDAERMFVYRLGEALGLKPHDGTSVQEYSERIKADYPYPIISFGNNLSAGSLDYFKWSPTHEVSLVELMNLIQQELAQKDLEVRISPEFTAVKKDDGVQVGCTFVSREILQKVNKLVFGKEA